jgi:excisionase family DNA binding protein
MELAPLGRSLKIKCCVANCGDFGGSAYLDVFFPVRTTQEWYTAKELAALLGRTDQFVRDMVDNGRILGHMLCGRGNSGRRTYQIHRNAVELYLLETANFRPPDYVRRILGLASSLPPRDREMLRAML